MSESYYTDLDQRALASELHQLDEELRQLHVRRAALFVEEEVLQEHRQEILSLLGVTAIQEKQ